MEQKTAKDDPIQGYIVDLKSPDPMLQYSIVLENSTDLIVRRDSKQTHRELVLLVSQNLYYIKENNERNIPLTPAKLDRFFGELKDEILPLNNVRWLSEVSKKNLGRIKEVIFNESISEMCRHHVINNIRNLSWFASYWNQDKDLFIKLHSLFPAMEDHNKYQSCIPAIFWIARNLGADDAIYFAEQLDRSKITRFYCSRPYYNEGHNVDAFSAVLTSAFQIDLRQFADYLFVKLYEQGYTEINESFFQAYLSFLKLQQDYYGEVKERFPSHFKTDYDILRMKIEEARADEAQKDFTLRYKTLHSLAYTAEGYCIVIPRNLMELHADSFNLYHNLSKVAEHHKADRNQVLFLRRKDAPDEPLVTLVLKDKCLCKVGGMDYRSITQQERNFLMQWAQEKGVQIAI